MSAPTPVRTSSSCDRKSSNSCRLLVRKKGEVYYLDFANGSWVYRAVGYADAISGGTVVILREVEEGAGDAS